MKLPYGQSNFRNVATEFYYVDRTQYIEALEQQANRFLFFLRPRKFGKSLFISMLEYYYGMQHKGDFERIFGKYYIGKNPTPAANSYLVLTLDFSGLQTDSKAGVYQQFTDKVRISIMDFFSAYAADFSKEDYDALDKIDAPNTLLDHLMARIRNRLPDRKLYILIDEYDHFANELIAFHLEDFKEIVGRNGFVRKFFEVIKEESRNGLVERMFATGVSPITLDSLTSGFNIAKKITTELDFHRMMGFTEEESMALLSHVGVQESDMPTVIADLCKWYNGYLFHPDADESLYNPNMLIYFGDYYQSHSKYPEKLLDENIASDYGKIRRMLGVGGEEMSLSILEDALAQDQVRANLTGQFSFDRDWVRDDYTSLLFYLGVLTVRNRAGSFWNFTIPNFVIKGLYYSYFLDTLRRRAELKETLFTDINNAFYGLSMDNELQPMLDILERILSRLSGRDVQRFGESHLQAIWAALLNTSQAYLVRTEHETERRFVDILCTKLPQIPINWSFAFELKYLKKSESKQLAAKAEEARTQLEAYLQSDDLRNIPNLVAYAIVFVGPKAKSVVRVG
jgi:hypothetical protein